MQGTVLGMAPPDLQREGLIPDSFWRDKYKKYTDTNGVLYRDYYSAMVNDQKGLNSAYSDDGVHTNKTGYEVINPLVEKAI